MASLSVVTPSLNHGAFIGQAIDSVGRAGSLPVEHIVIDGGSTDGTVRALAGRNVRVEVRPGSTSHEAINLGIAAASGDIVGVLNADDRYDHGALDAVLACFRADPAIEAVCGGMRFFRTDGTAGETELWRRGHLDGAALMLELTFGAPGFNSWFFRRRLLDRLGPLDPAWDFAADRDLLLRLSRHTRPAVLDRLVYHYRVHPGSRTMRPDRINTPAIAAEHIRLARHHLDVCRDDPATMRILAAWWGLEWVKLKAAGAPATPVPAAPPPAAPPTLAVALAFWLHLQQKWKQRQCR